MMKLRMITVALTLLFCSNVKAQWRLETQFAGANFAGASLNIGYDFNLTADQMQKLTTTFGIGGGVFGPLYNVDLTYYYTNWGIGVQGAQHFEGYTIYNIVYPHLSYRFGLSSKWYMTLTAGACFEFERYYTEGAYYYTPIGDVIGMGGLSIGYRLGNK